MPGAQWFPGARLSYAEHFFRGRDDDAVAIHHAGELRELSQWTWGELREQTAAHRRRAAARSASARATASPPTCRTSPRPIAAFLATRLARRRVVERAPEFGARSVIDRFAQIEPKVLLAVDGYRYGGRDFDRSEVVAGIAARDRRASTCASATWTAAAGRDGARRAATSR